MFANIPRLGREGYVLTASLLSRHFLTSKACCVCGWVHWVLTVGFILFRYAVVCNAEFLSLIYHLLISRFVCTRR